MAYLAKSPRARLLTIKDVVEELQVTERTVRRWIADGKLKAVKIGGGWRVHPRDLDRMLDLQ